MPRSLYFTISANALFHFTRSKENLIGILQNAFFPRYALENQNLVEPEIPELHIAIPMVSFCDIPLSQVKGHIRNYGEYALGLTKNWGKTHGIAPVLYAYPGALSSQAISILSQCFPRGSFVSPEIPWWVQAYQAVTYFSLYVKRYEGRIYRNGQYSSEIVRFYNEREWRYVPSINILSRAGISAFLPKKYFDDEVMLVAENDKIAEIAPLAFEPKFIKYVIVRSDSEILEVMDAISRIKGQNFSYDDVRKLTTRIISVEQILEDF